MILYGRNSVLERLKANPSSVRKVLLQENIELPDIENLVKKNKISFERLPLRQLEKIKRTKDLQGIAAKIDRFEYTPFSDLLTRSYDKHDTIIFLDRINDPQNLGVIIRTASCFGAFSVVIPKFEACEVNETVLHVASGGENYISIAMVTNLSTAIITAKKRGYWIAGAVIGDDAEDIDKVSFPFPLSLVLGSEGEGIRYGVQRHLDLKVRIPMRGAKLSFNVNTACAIFCHEISRQRDA